MKLEEKITLLKQLYHMSKVDGEIVKAELDFLVELALSLEVPYEVIEDIFCEKTIYLKKELPDNISGRIIQIYRLALMMNVDNHIKFEEVHLLKSIAVELKLPPESVTAMVSEIIKSENGTLNPEHLFDIFNIKNN